MMEELIYQYAFNPRMDQFIHYPSEGIAGPHRIRIRQGGAILYECPGPIFQFPNPPLPFHMDLNATVEFVRTVERKN